MPDPSVPAETDQPAEPVQPVESAEAAEVVPSGSDDDPDAPVFLNRAARRTRGKATARGTVEQPAQGRGKSFGGRGSVQGPRQWGNRRSG
jgi:hypothetical protein